MQFEISELQLFHDMNQLEKWNGNLQVTFHLTSQEVNG